MFSDFRIVKIGHINNKKIITQNYKDKSQICEICTQKSQNNNVNNMFLWMSKVFHGITSVGKER